jgi:RecA/RadA recombinase
MPKKAKEAAVPETVVQDEKASATQNSVRKYVETMAKSKRYAGHIQISVASDLNTSHMLRRRTGILGLDLALGGGFHSGGSAEIFGSESVGKTYLAFRTGGQLQEVYGNDAAIYIYSTEIKPDKGFARCAGLCVAYSENEINEYDAIRQGRGFPPFSRAERADLCKQIGEVVVTTAENAEVGLQGVLDAVESRLFPLIIIESLGALLPKDVDEGDLDDGHYGGSSKAVTTFQNKLYKPFMMNVNGVANSTTIIGINQARAVIGGSPRGPKTKAAAGAFAWKHGQLASVELSRGADIRDVDSEKTVMGKEVHWKLAKGKAGTHDGKRGGFNYFHVNKSDPVFWKDYLETWLGGADIIPEAVETGKQLGVLRLGGSWTYWEDDGQEIMRCQGIENFAEKLAQDPALVEKFRESCIKKSGLLVRYK